LPDPAPIGVPNFFIDSFQIPPFLLPIYRLSCPSGGELGVAFPRKRPLSLGFVAV